MGLKEEVIVQQEFGVNLDGEMCVREPLRNHVIFFSGGKASFAVADFVKKMHPNDNIILYFTDVMWENEDLYRFIKEASDKLELPLLVHGHGLNPLQLMFEKKMIYNSRIGDCSRILKMQVASRFLRKGLKPKVEYWRNQEYLLSDEFIINPTLYFGISFEEMHREKAIVKNWRPFRVEMPLIEHSINVDKVLALYNIQQPVLYDLGFSHNNCNGRCVKAGQGHYKNLKTKMPEVFKKIMEQEHHLNVYVSAYRYIKNIESDGRDGFTEDYRLKLYEELDDAYRDYFYDRVEKPKLYIHPAASANTECMVFKRYSFMKKKKKPYALRELNLDIERNSKLIDSYDIGGCGCFVS